MDKRPKRRKDKYNPYTLCSEKGKYYVYFVDVNNRIQMVEVSKSVFETFNIFELEDISQMNEYDRHLEHSEAYEHTLHKKKVFMRYDWYKEKRKNDISRRYNWT